MSAALSTRHAPSFSLVRAHFALGLLGLCAFAVALVTQARWIDVQFFQPTVLGLVHLCVLGWLLPIALGALHQLVPVLFETKLRSERVAWIAFGAYVVGAAIFVVQLFRFDVRWPLPFGATLLATSLVVYVSNLVATMARGRGRTLVGANVGASLVYLVVAATLGATLAWNLHRPFVTGDHLQWLRAHAHVAVLGFFGLLVMGVAHRLSEMFLLSHGAKTRSGWIAFAAVNLGLAALFTSFVDAGVGGTSLTFVVGASSVVVGLVAFFFQMRAVFARRMQRRLDVAFRNTVASFVYLGAAAVLGVVVACWPTDAPMHARLVLAYGFVAIVGFVGSIVVGQLYKIVPFLVWLHRFSAYVGLAHVPAASELLAERPKRVQGALMHAGIAIVAVGIVVRSVPLRVLGALLFAASAAFVARNLIVVDGRRP